MSTIPNQLNITIRTSIPGYQKVQYKPSMTIKNIGKDDSSVKFNPLIKLQKSVIDKIPENLRIKEFFNKGLFDSLINYTNSTAAKTLTLATRYGYVDNNIKLTLETIFPSGSVIYIGEKPYVIADVQWSSGDWKIDTKQKKENLDPNKIADPYLYSTVVREDIISGEEQLKNLPDNLIYGANFSGPPITGRGIMPAQGTPEPGTGTPPTGTTSTPPSEPTITSINSGNQQLMVNFTAPLENGGSIITNYEYSIDNGRTFNSSYTTSTPITIRGLTNGTNYPIVIRAINSRGVSRNSNMIVGRPNATVVPRGRPPSEPTITSINPSNQRLMVNFTAPIDNGGSIITNYEYSIDDGRTFTNFGNNVSPILIRGLTNGTNYPVIIRAVNSIGVSRNSNMVVGTPNIPLIGPPSSPSPSPSSPSPSLPSPSPSSSSSPSVRPAIEGPAIEGPAIEEPEIIHDRPGPIIPLAKSSQPTNFLKRYFKRNYYGLLNTIYQNFGLNVKRMINGILSNTTRYAVSESNNTLTERPYNSTVDNLNVYSNTGGGDCFFIAVAQAINLNNNKNPSNKIISGVYGTGNVIFTQDYLRTIVDRYISRLPDLETYIQNGIVNSDHINIEFENQVRAIVDANGGIDLTPEQYLQVARDVYGSNDNFCVTLPNAVPISIDDYFRPFTPINRGEISRYIRSSNYWANELAIAALSNELQINVIPIEKSNGNLRVTYGNFLTTENNNWNKYLFLYNSENHFELLTFNVDKKHYNTVTKKSRIITKENVIFEKTNLNVTPPFYIIFLIFATKFRDLSEDNKRNFTVLPQFMNVIEASLDNILNDRDNPTLPRFIENYNNYFPYNTPLIQHGGIGQYGRPYMPQYGKPYLAQNMVKREDEYDPSKIAYWITIDMELYPGTSIKPDQMRNLKCNSKWNAIRKAYSEFIGKPYIIPPAYELSKYAQSEKSKKQNITKKANIKRGGKTIKNRE